MRGVPDADPRLRSRCWAHPEDDALVRQHPLHQRQGGVEGGGVGWLSAISADAVDARDDVQFPVQAAIRPLGGFQPSQEVRQSRTHGLGDGGEVPVRDGRLWDRV
jgi:hypothetical protein